jgi:hypothetical protein
LYDETVANVAPDWELDVRDFGMLDQACELADAAARLKRIIVQEGEVTRGSRGQPVVHPAVGQLRAHRVAIAAVLAKIEIAPPRKRTTTRHGADQLRDARRARWHG